MCAGITATAKINGKEVKDIPVLNPGDWFGKCWLIEISGSYWPLFLVAEGDTVSSVIDELADNETYGHQIVVANEDLGDYPEDARHYSGSGHVLDLDHLMVHGQEGVACPFPCVYHGDGLPAEGMKPTDYYQREEEPC